MLEKPKIICVVGPTASGKSALALALAERLSGEIVCCDSMQIYRDMNIGTAKPTPRERATVPHHLFDLVDPFTSFSVQDYVVAANAAVKEIVSRGKMPVFCGGTGLYLDAFLRGGVAETPKSDPLLRAQLAQSAAADGGAALYAELNAADPESAAAIHPNNIRRVIRAVEIYRLTGVPKSEWDRRSRMFTPTVSARVLGLEYRNRETLYARIERRVEEMLAAGLVKETEALREKGVFRHSATAAAAIGYKELLPYLEGEISLAQAVEDLKTATKRYAKRQLTWFGAKEYVRRIYADEGGIPLKFEEIVNNALAICQE